MLMLQTIGRQADGGSGSLIDNITKARQLLVSEVPGKEKICFEDSKDKK